MDSAFICPLQQLWESEVVFEDAVPVAKKCVQEKKPEAFGSVLASAWTQGKSFQRFEALFGPW